MAPRISKLWLMFGAFGVALLVTSALFASWTEQSNLSLRLRLKEVRKSRDRLLDTLARIQSDELLDEGTSPPGDDAATANVAPAPATGRAPASVPLPPFAGVYECQPEGVFSGAWFAATDFFLSLHLVPANVEGATFGVVGAGQCVRTLDFLDFWLEHLSVYEQTLGVITAPEDTRVEFAVALEQNLERHTRELARAVPLIPRSPAADEARHRVLAVVPFYGGAIGGASHSLANTRLAYLDATIRSLVPVFPNVVVGVLSEQDRATVAARGLPLLEVMLVDQYVSKNDNLATATLLVAQDRLRQPPASWAGRGPFDRVYYTEGDQVLRMRSWAAVLDVVQGHVVLAPHRTMAVASPPDFPHDLNLAFAQHGPSAQFLATISPKPVTVLGVDIEHDGSCCLVGINPHPPSTSNFWYNARGFSDYPYLWRQLGSLAMIPGEQGHDAHGWTCNLLHERVPCTNPYM